MSSHAATSSTLLVATPTRRHTPHTRLTRALSASHRPPRFLALRAAADFGEAASSDAQEPIEAQESPTVGDALKALEEETGEAPEAAAEGVEEGPPAVDREVDCFSLNFLWLERNVGVAVDHWFTATARSPLTEYFFWPRTDAWEELKACMESKPWISERDKVLLLNRTTEVINYWQDEEIKHTLDDAKEAFPDCDFVGR